MQQESCTKTAQKLQLEKPCGSMHYPMRTCPMSR